MTLYTKHHLLQALQTATFLQSLPSGHLIVELQRSLSANDFNKAIKYISDNVWSSFEQACPEDLLAELQRLQNRNEDVFYDQLQLLVQTNPSLGQIFENALVFYTKHYTRTQL